tara:strand:+ start:543 stop:701 length:159 start_codon:yes stop_codon:yes gene_type:complete
LKHTLTLGAILSNQEMQDFLEKVDDAAGDWLGLDDEEMQEATHISVTFETPD